MSALILTMGPPGVGKTSLSRRLATRVGAVYLCSDSLSQPIFGDDRGSTKYLDLRDRLYASLYLIAEQNLEHGLSVLLDAPHVRSMMDARWRDRIGGIAVRTVALKIIRLTCSSEVLRSRLAARGEARDSSKLLDWQEFLRDQPLDVDIPIPHIDINSESDLDTQLDIAAAYLETE